MTGERLTDEQRTMVEANLGLVKWVLARRGCPPHVYDDRYQDGVLGLMRAVQLYDPTIGAFSTYAHRWIVQAMDRGQGRQEGANFRRANGAKYGHRVTPSTDYERPMSLDALRFNDSNDTFDGTAVFGAVDDHVETVPDAIDAAALVEKLDLCDDDIVALMWPISDVAVWFNISARAARGRRRCVRARIQRRIAALTAAA